MGTLLADRYAPVTWSAGFLEAPLETVAAALLEWREQISRRDIRELFRPRRGTRIVARRFVKRELLAMDRQAPSWHYISEAVEDPFPEVLLRLEPLRRAGQERELLLATDSSWTAYFDNGWVGLERVTPVLVLSQKLKCRGLVVTCSPRIPPSNAAPEGYESSVQFQLFAERPTGFLNYLRTIAATHDSERWVFAAHGEQQPFEKPERYLVPRVPDRFPPELLEEYCAAVGVRYFDPAYYLPRGVLLAMEPPLKGITLAEARRRWGISP